MPMPVGMPEKAITRGGMFAGGVVEARGSRGGSRALLASGPGSCELRVHGTYSCGATRCEVRARIEGDGALVLDGWDVACSWCVTGAKVLWCRQSKPSSGGWRCCGHGLVVRSKQPALAGERNNRQPWKTMLLLDQGPGVAGVGPIGEPIR